MLRRYARAHPLVGPDIGGALSQLAAIDVDQTTADAMGDWHYWVAQGYLF